MSNSLSDLDFLQQALAPRRPPNQAGPPTSRHQSDSTTRTAPGDAPLAPPHTSSSSSSPTSAASPPPPPHLAALLSTLHASSTSILVSRNGPSPPSPPQGGDAPLDPESDLDLDPSSLAALLAKLDDADSAAQDLEGRLDGLLTNLDHLLGALGGGAVDDDGDGDGGEAQEATGERAADEAQ